MGLIHYEQMEDDVDATANLWNERFGVLFNEINGNLDAANIKNGAITSAKIATAAITSDKLFVEREYDNEGWLVTDYGAYKRYTRTGVFNQTAAANAFGYLYTNIAFPAGTSEADIVGSYVAATDQAISIGFSANQGGKISFNYQNKYGQPAPLNVRWTITFER